jgi:hypothetical protein
MNWGDLRDEIRVMLEDTSLTNPKYPDEVLFTYLREAVADYSINLPLVKEDVELTKDGTNPKKFALPSDFLEEEAVACPLGTYLETRQVRPGTRNATSRRPLFYRRDGLSLYLDADPGEDKVFLNYEAMHPIPVDASDTDFVMTIPPADMELIKLYVNASVNTRVRSAQARLDRFKIGAGGRTDNPMTQEVEDLFKVYYQKIAARIPSHSIKLSRQRKWK